MAAPAHRRLAAVAAILRVRRLLGGPAVEEADVADRLARRRLGDIRRGQVQQLVDDLTRKGRSGSRIRSVVDALRSLYQWAQDRELTARNPAELVRLPAMEAKPRNRVATPPEFADLLATCVLEDALPFALAGYGTARKQEICVLDWQHVDPKMGAIELAADEEGRKPGGSWRVVPLVKPLRIMLHEAWIAKGRPKQGKVCPPRQYSRSGMLSVGDVARRVQEAWEEAGMEPIGLHESWHTAATWLDHAGMSQRWPRRSWATRRLPTSRAPRRSRSGATRTPCPASWNGPAICSTGSSSSVWRRRRRASSDAGFFPSGLPCRCRLRLAGRAAASYGAASNRQAVAARRLEG